MVEPSEKGPLIGYGRTADIFIWADDRVLKLFHENWSVTVAEEEARIGRLVRDMGLPVPNVLGTVADGARFGIGSQFHASSHPICWPSLGSLGPLGVDDLFRRMERHNKKPSAYSDQSTGPSLKSLLTIKVATPLGLSR